MITKQAIQSSANVVRITSVSAGDVYKRFDESYEDRTYYGVVKAVHNDGEKTIIESTEYCYKYNDVDVTHKIINGTKDYVIFPSTPEELNLELDGARKKQLDKIRDAKDQIATSEKLIAEIDGLLSGETQKSLQSMSYKELTQNEYNSKLQEISA